MKIMKSIFAPVVSINPLILMRRKLKGKEE